MEHIELSEGGMVARGSDIEGCYAGRWLTEQAIGWTEEMLFIFATVVLDSGHVI